MGFPLSLPGTSINPIIHVPRSLVTIKLKSLLSVWWTLTSCLRRLPQLEPHRIMLHFIPFLFFCPHFCIVLDIMGCSSDFCHIFTGFTTFRWGGRWLGASDMDVFCSDIFILCKTSEVKELWSLGLNSSTEHKLQTPAWALEGRWLSPGTKWIMAHVVEMVLLCLLPIESPVMDVQHCSWPFYLLRKDEFKMA